MGFLLDIQVGLCDIDARLLLGDLLLGYGTGLGRLLIAGECGLSLVTHRLGGIELILEIARIDAS